MGKSYGRNGVPREGMWLRILPIASIVGYVVFRGVLLGDSQFLSIYPGDASVYYQISKNPFSFVEAPFSYRFIVPLIAYISPLSNIWDFRVISFLSLISILILLEVFFRNEGIGREYAIFGTILFLLMPTTLATIGNIALVDFPAYVLFLTALIGIQRDNVQLWGVSVIVGVFVKEIVIFTMPILFIYYFVRQKGNLLMYATGYSLLAILLLITVRVLYTSSTVQTDLSIESLIQHHLSNVVPEMIGVIATFHVMYLSIWSAYDWPRLFRVGLLTLFPVSLASLLLATDAARVLSINFPFIIGGFLYTMEESISDLDDYWIGQKWMKALIFTTILAISVVSVYIFIVYGSN